MNNEITVAEYSKITGLSRKTIYDKIKKGKLFAEERRGEDNRPVKFILLDIPVEEFRKLAENGAEQEKTEVKNVNNVNEEQRVNEVINPVNVVNEEVKKVKRLEETEGEQVEQALQPEGKDTRTTEQFLLEEIKELREQIKEKDRQLLEFANKFAELAQQSNLIAEKAIHTTGQAQILQAVDKKDKIVEVLEEPKEEEKIGYKPPKEGEEPKGFWQKLAYWFTH